MTIITPFSYAKTLSFIIYLISACGHAALATHERKRSLYVCTRVFPLGCQSTNYHALISFPLLPQGIFLVSSEGRLSNDGKIMQV